MTQPPKKAELAARVHPDERSRIAALNTVGQALRGAPAEKHQTSYYTPLLVQCTLPHSDPKTRDWIKTNGDFSLMVTSGIDKEGQPYGVPYGSFPRLAMAYMITQVIQTGERRIELSAHFGEFLKEIGYTGNLRGNIRPAKSVQGQLIRLLTSTIAFEKSTGDSEKGAILRGKADIASKFMLWWDYKQPTQGSLFGSFIDLSEDFYKAILANPLPLRTDILAALKKSPLALDVYMWVSYRLFTLQAAGQEQVTLGYGRLQEQFGTGVAEANYRQFRQQFKIALAKVAQYWTAPDGTKELLNYELHKGGLTLFRSPLLVGPAKPKPAEIAAAAEAARILSSRKFDDITLKQGRHIAGTQWDIHWLSNQYFEWIGREGITPKDLRAHFLKFVKSHCERNEK